MAGERSHPGGLTEAPASLDVAMATDALARAWQALFILPPERETIAIVAAQSSLDSGGWKSARNIGTPESWTVRETPAVNEFEAAVDYLVFLYKTFPDAWFAAMQKGRATFTRAMVAAGKAEVVDVNAIDAVSADAWTLDVKPVRDASVEAQRAIMVSEMTARAARAQRP